MLPVVARYIVQVQGVHGCISEPSLNFVQGLLQKRNLETTNSKLDLHESKLA